MISPTTVPFVFLFFIIKLLSFNWAQLDCECKARGPILSGRVIDGVSVQRSVAFPWAVSLSFKRQWYVWEFKVDKPKILRH